MPDIDLVPLTPAQRTEVDDLDTDLVDAWLEAYKVAPATIKNPVGWFLNGVRSGNMPFEPSAMLDAQAEARAERYVRNAGYLLDRESELEDALWGDHGILRHSSNDALRERLLTLYRALRPQGEQVEADFLERAARFRAQRRPAAT